MEELDYDGHTKKFRFSIDVDLVLVRCVGLNNAHLANYDEVESKWEGVHSMFCAAPEIVRKLENESIAPPKARTLTERFTQLIRDRISESKRNIAALGVSETFGKR